MNLNIVGKSEEKAEINLKAQKTNQWLILDPINLTLLGIGTTISGIGGIFLRLKTMNLLVRRRILTKKNYQVQMPVLTNYQNQIKKSLAKKKSKQISFFGGASGIGKSQSFKRLINNKGQQFHQNISYWDFKTQSGSKVSQSFYKNNHLPQPKYTILAFKIFSMTAYEPPLNYLNFIIGQLVHPLQKPNRYLFYYCFPSLASFLLGIYGLWAGQVSILTGSMALFGLFTWFFYPFIMYCKIKQPHIIIFDDINHLVKSQEGKQFIKKIFALHNNNKIALNVISSDNKCFSQINSLQGLKERVLKIQIFPEYQQDVLKHIYLLRNSPQIRKYFVKKQNLTEKILIHILNDQLFSKLHLRKFSSLLIQVYQQIKQLNSQEQKFSTTLKFCQQFKNNAINQIGNSIKSVIVELRKQALTQNYLFKENLFWKIQFIIMGPEQIEKLYKKKVIKILKKIIKTKGNFQSETTEQSLIEDKLNHKNIIRYVLVPKTLTKRIDFESPFLQKCLEIWMKQYEQKEKEN